MIQKRQLLINAVLSAVQVVVVGGSFFVLYRFLLETIGEEEFGVWSVVLASTAASSVANLGFGSSATKFVSQYLAREDREAVGRVVQTAALSVAAFLGVVMLAAYPLLGALLGVVIEPPGQVAAARSILPYALVAFWMTSVSLVFQSSLDGFQRVDLRNLLLSGVAIAYLVLAFVFVPEHGLLGLARVQVAQAALLLAGSWVLLRRLARGLPLVPYRWHRPTFSEMLGYSLNFQVISLTYMLLEPTTTALVSRFGGVSMAGYYEMARRMVYQLRSLFVTAHQAIVPTIADLQERDPTLIRSLYAKSFHLLGFLILPALPLFIALTPLISRLWIGAYEPDFVHAALLLFAGWFLNMAAGPAYFANLGTGEMRWNVAGHLVMGGLNLSLGLLLGFWLGGLGAVVGLVAGLLAGSLLIAWAYQREHDIRTADLFLPGSGLLALSGVLGLVLVLALYDRLIDAWPPLALLVALTAAYAAVVAVPLWRHPVRRQLQGWGAMFFRAGSNTPST